MTALSFKITNKLLNKILIEYKENPDKEIVQNFIEMYNYVWNICYCINKDSFIIFINLINISFFMDFINQSL